MLIFYKVIYCLYLLKLIVSKMEIYAPHCDVRMLFKAMSNNNMLISFLAEVAERSLENKPNL